MVRDNSEDKAERILSIYTKLTQGKVINKAQQSHLYGVSERTIQRDIVDIQCFLQNQELETGEIQEITYSKRAGGYILQTKNRKCLDSKDVLAVGKILLESRALVKEELFPILHNLSRFCCDCENEKAVEDFLRNEMHHYVELQHKEWLEALESVSYWTEIPRERILKSIEEFNFGDNEYVLDFQIINLDYEIGSDPKHLFSETATEKYRVSVLRSGGVWLSRYVVFVRDSEEIRFECTDREPESGTKFEIGDIVKFVKDPFNDDWIVKGKIGTKRGFGMADDSNFYYIEKVGDEERHFDNAHETELTKVK